MEFTHTLHTIVANKNEIANDSQRLQITTIDDNNQIIISDKSNSSMIDETNLHPITAAIASSLSYLHLGGFGGQPLVKKANDWNPFDDDIDENVNNESMNQNTIDDIDSTNSSSQFKILHTNVEGNNPTDGVNTNEPSIKIRVHVVTTQSYTFLTEKSPIDNSITKKNVFTPLKTLFPNCLFSIEIIDWSDLSQVILEQLLTTNTEQTKTEEHTKADETMKALDTDQTLDIDTDMNIHTNTNIPTDIDAGDISQLDSEDLKTETSQIPITAGNIANETIDNETQTSLESTIKDIDDEEFDKMSLKEQNEYISSLTSTAYSTFLDQQQPSKYFISEPNLQVQVHFNLYCQQVVNSLQDPHAMICYLADTSFTQQAIQDSEEAHGGADEGSVVVDESMSWIAPIVGASQKSTPIFFVSSNRHNSKVMEKFTTEMIAAFAGLEETRNEKGSTFNISVEETDDTITTPTSTTAPIQLTLPSMPLYSDEIKDKKMNRFWRQMYIQGFVPDNWITPQQ